MTMVPVNDNRAMDLGQTQLRPQDFVPPRVKIVQQMSQEVADKLAAPGDLFNTLTGENFGTTIAFAPLLTFMQRIFLVRQEKAAAMNTVLAGAGLTGDAQPGLSCRSFDMYRGQGNPGDELWADHEKGCNECPLSQWRRGADGKNLPPLCTELYNVAGVSDTGDLVILSFSKSGAKVGKRLFSAVRMASAGKATWATMYEIATVATRNDLGNFFVPTFKKLPDPTPTDILKAAMYWSHEIKGVRMDVTPLDEDQAGDDPGPDDSGALSTEGAEF